MSRGGTSGILYGVGTGPGDPELVTRKAWRVVESAKVIAYPAPLGGSSFTRAIMADAIRRDATEMPIAIPMLAGRAPAQKIYDAAAAGIAAHLAGGDDVAMLCEGDPLFYGSFMYILARLREGFHVEIIPGVTSMTACAATHHAALAGRKDTIIVIPATLDDAALRRRIALADCAVIIKLGRHIKRLRALLAAMGLAGETLYTSHASLPQMRACALADAPDDAPYFSMLIIRKGNDPWL